MCCNLDQFGTMCAGFGFRVKMAEATVALHHRKPTKAPKRQRLAKIVDDS